MAIALTKVAGGTAAGILTYSFVCLAFGLSLLWLAWVHTEYKSYVGLLSFFVSLHTLASIAQQIYTIVRWRDIKFDQYNYLVAHIDDPQLSSQNTMTGLVRALFYIQYYSYNVESLLLANSIFQVHVFSAWRFHASLIAKAVAALLPIVQVMLLNLAPVRRSKAGYIVLSIGIMTFCFGVGTLVLFAILARYLHSRITLATWSVRYGRSMGSTNKTGNGTGTDPARRAPRRSNIYDKWLVLRFSIGFAALALFQLVVITYQLRSSNANNAASIPPEPDLSASHAKSDFAEFPPAVTACIVIFLVFGTTRTFREYMWHLFVPGAVGWKAAREKQPTAAAAGGSVSVVHSAAGRELETGNAGAILTLDDLPRRGLEGKSDEIVRRGENWFLHKPE
ncbi:hypothetical protein C8A01DRAFT_51632 [Parachaetomium inaequale]|uniref:Uncharacterized protein n=1 Tax=Parachaetomium inaequale TaxID=2588326 RepID=A0AAN6SL09_9PEZI|nr:hypothetical protein C8A01DRAFT_51632 [Parachaetomium inaequale]